MLGNLQIDEVLTFLFLSVAQD